MSSLVFGWYGNGAADGQLTTSTAGRGDDLFTAVNGAADTFVASGQIRMNEAGASRNMRRSVPAPLNEWAVVFEYTHRAVSSGTAILQILDPTPTQILRLEVNSSNTLTLRDTANGTIQTVPGAVTPGSTYRVVATGSTAGTVTVKVYLGGDLVATLSGASGSVQPLQWAVWGSVASATATGARAFDNLEIWEGMTEPPFISENGSVVRVLTNPGAFVPAGGAADIVTALSDGSSTTRMESVDNPTADIITLQLARLSRSDIVTVQVDDDISAAGSIARRLELLNGVSVLATSNYTITSTSTSTRTISTPSAVAAGEVVVLRITDVPA